jgi:hypothetical protein
MKRWPFVLMGLLLLAVGGCSSLKGYVDSYIEIGKERGMSEEYLDGLQTWTRGQTVYSEFETRFYISATFKSEAFIQAFLKEQARLLLLAEEEKEKRVGVQRQASSEFTEIFFYAYTANRSANDFGDRNSTWRVFLLDPAGRQISPLEIRKVDPITSTMESFFPYINKYYGFCYNVRFPRQDGENLKLIFTSHIGKMELTWALRGSP